MLITTGRKPDALSRLMAKALAAAIPGSLLENRGRRTLGALIAKARKKHFTRVCTIYKDGGKPCQMAFISLGEDAGWEWLSPKITVRKAAASIIPRNFHSPSLELSGTRKATIANLLSVSDASGGSEPESEISAGAASLSVSLGDKKVLQLEVSYEN